MSVLNIARDALARISVMMCPYCGEGCECPWQDVALDALDKIGWTDADLARMTKGAERE